ncbi:SNF1-interacting protein [Entomophthora muscae]|uniref:SNF1-interacting protein n=1 Tax=Entomophthora muscae TaxID=34485 RepID=A0ACC2SJB3_9FUNG|nr:SNF1-interacting protein [Entomophthora muscae]
MGNSQAKFKADESFDLGRLTPFGTYPSASQDYDVKLVKQLITERQIAPYYKGLNDLTEIDQLISSPSSSPLRLKSHSHDSSPCGHTRSPSCSSKSLSIKGPSKKERVIPTERIKTLYKDALECPICFLLYPRNINYSTCCDEPICTECLIQIKSPEGSSEPPNCPYCAYENFSVVYSNFENSLFGGDEAVVSVDIKPTLHKKATPVYLSKIRPEHVRPTKIGINRTGHGSTGRFLSLRPSRRNRNHSNTEYGEYLMAMQSMGVDLEELMMMEAIRESLRDAEERERERERDPPEIITDQSALLSHQEDTTIYSASSPISPTSGREILSVTSTLSNLPGASDETCPHPPDKVSQDSANHSDTTPTCEI